MKKFTKGMCIAAAVTAILGVCCLIASFAVGLKFSKLAEMFESGRFSIVFGGNHYVKDHILENDEIEEGVANIDIEFGAGELVICYGDVRDIQLEYKNAAGFGWTCDEDTLHIFKEIVFDDNSDVYLKITLPKNTTYEEINLKIGASKAEITDICAEEINITVGAGKADIKNLHADKIDLEVGAGELNVENLEVKALDVECGVGKVNAEILGMESDYDFSVDCGIGTVKIGDRTLSGLGADYDNDHHDDKHHGVMGSIDIECGLGEVAIQFICN